MRVMLIQPPLVAADRYGSKMGRLGPTTLPLGLAYIAAVLEARGDYVRIVDAAARKMGYGEIVEECARGTYDWIGVSMLTPMYLTAARLIGDIRKRLPRALIVAGGVHPTLFPETTLEEIPGLDVVVMGEGELTVRELSERIGAGAGLEGVGGLAYRTGGGIVVNEARTFIRDLDTIPLPARHLAGMDRYRPAASYYRRLPSYTMLTSRGCPFHCSYCSKIFGNIFRAHSVGRIIEEMNVLVQDYGAREVIFRDDTFAINREHTEELCRELITRGMHRRIPWSCMTRVDCIRGRQYLARMKEAGCWGIHFGVESGSQRLLDIIEKGSTIEHIRKVFAWCRELGMETRAFFMLGLPTETREESLNTIRFARELDPDWVQFTLTVPYPGTNLFSIAQKTGSLKSLKWENYQTWGGWSDKELVYVTDGRDAEDLKALQKQAMRVFYLRPKIIFRHIVNLIRNPRLVLKYVNGAIVLISSKFNVR